MDQSPIVLFVLPHGKHAKQFFVFYLTLVILMIVPSLIKRVILYYRHF